MGRGEGEQLRFRLGTVSMEFEVGISHSVGGDAGVRFWVVTAGASGERGSTMSHRILLQLTPLLGGEADPLISERQREDPLPNAPEPPG